MKKYYLKIVLSVLIFAPILIASMSSFAADAKEGQARQEPAQQSLPKEVASDTNKDGKPDRWEYYANGVISSVAADTNNDGTIDEKGYFEKGKLVKVEKDTDGDNKMDKWVTY